MKFRDSGVAERPKVVFNVPHQEYVTWIHLDANRYAEASAGVAVSASPAGPFRVVRIFILFPSTTTDKIGADSGAARRRASGAGPIATWRSSATTTAGCMLLFMPRRRNWTLYVVRFRTPNEYMQDLRVACLCRV